MTQNDKGTKEMQINTIHQGNCLDILKTLPDKSVDCCVTSPPYYKLRDYGMAEQIGLEETPDEYIGNLVEVFTEVYRVLKDTGTLWINIADTYNGRCLNNGAKCDNKKWKQSTDTSSQAIDAVKTKCLAPKSLIGIPFRLALNLQAAGWIFRQDIIWAKSNGMPESVTDRFCKSHEYLFLFSKRPNYFFDITYAMEIAKGCDKIKNGHRGYTTKDNATGLTPQNHGAIGYPFRLKRDVWTIATEQSSEMHYAMFPQALIKTPILCGCPNGGIVLDPFMGGGTTALVARKNMRKYIGIELNPKYIDIANRRLADEMALFEEAR